MYLRPPQLEKQFLISPPVSPPIGWEQKIEDPPIVDLNLVAAIAQLQPSEARSIEKNALNEIFLFPDESHELLPKKLGSKTPSIVIHTCDDAAAPDIFTDLNRPKLIKPSLTQTRRPPAM